MMNHPDLFSKIYSLINDKLITLEDKPEEDVESTIKALWLAAAGINTSVVKATQLTLPELTAEQIQKLNELVDLRLKNVPLAHLTNRQDFMGIEFIVDNRALIPRKETEILAKKAIGIISEESKTKELLKVIDVCCGSGNLGISIAFYNQKCKVYSSDISSEAVELTRENIKILNLEGRVDVSESDLFSVFESDSFYHTTDLIVCNPPYISTSKVEKMNPEIASFEPSLAFDGGSFGFKIIQRLIHDSPRFLKKDGWLLFEVGAGQGEFVTKMLEKTNLYHSINSEKDQFGNIRVIIAQAN